MTATDPSATDPSATDPSATDPVRTPWPTLAAVCFGLFMVGLDSTVVHIANPSIQADLGATFGELQWIINAYLLALAVLLIPSGKLGDRFGRKRLYLLGLALFGVASVGIGLIGSVAGVLALRALQGLAAAMLMPQTLALLRATFPRDRFAMAVGIWGGVSSVSIAAGPLVSGLLVAALGWEWVFYINVPIAVIGIVFSAFAIRETPKQRGDRTDVGGIVLLGGFLFALVFGIVQSESWGWADARTIGVLAAGLVCLIAFVIVERQVAEPLLPPALFRSAGVSVGCVVFLANFFTILGITFLITLFLLNTLGHDTVTAGALMLPMSLFAIPSAPLGAFLTSKIGPRRVAAIGLLLMAIGLAVLTQVGIQTPYWMMAIGFVVIAFGSGFAIPSGADLLVGGAPMRLAGVASGLQTTSIQVGGAFGTAVLSAIVSAIVLPQVAAAGLAPEDGAAAAAGVPFDGLPQISEAFIGSLRIGYVVCIVFCLAAAALVLIAVRETGHREVEAVLEESLAAEDGHR